MSERKKKFMFDDSKPLTNHERRKIKLFVKTELVNKRNIYYSHT